MTKAELIKALDNDQIPDRAEISLGLDLKWGVGTVSLDFTWVRLNTLIRDKASIEIINNK